MYLIFDFDGTLVNSFRCMVELFNQLADEFDIRKVNKNDINNLRDLNSQEIINYLKIPLYKIPSIIFRVRKHLRNQMLTLTPVPDLPKVLQKLYEDGWSLGIVTSNSTTNVNRWLHEYDLAYLFKFIRAESNFFSKKNLLIKLIKAHGIDKSKAFYIGDETRDIEAAKQSDIYSIAVTWGYNSEKALIQYQPHFIARKPEELLTILGKRDEAT